MKKLLLTIFTIANTLGMSAEGICYTKQDVCYTRADSVKVVSLLKEGATVLSTKGKASSKSGGDLMLYYGKQLQGIPYVSHTLEVNKKEQLVVNLRQLDCTTFVETVLALAITTRQHTVQQGKKPSVSPSTLWADYCSNLTKIRYDRGVMDGYTSRNHYFLWWVESNRKQGIVSTPLDELQIPSSKGSVSGSSATKLPSFIHRQIIKLNWMSTHSDSYSMLNGDKDAIKKIAAHEKSSFGATMLYIPAASTGLGKSQLSIVHDGDILAIATKKAGLDTSHIGIASWGKEGKLHLLNASQIHHKVILEPMSLYDYMSEHPSQLGIWVICPNL